MALFLKPSFADLGSGDEKVKKIDAKKFLTPGYSTSGHVELYTVSIYTVYKPHRVLYTLAAVGS